MELFFDFNADHVTVLGDYGKRFSIQLTWLERINHFIDPTFNFFKIIYGDGVRSVNQKYQIKIDVTTDRFDVVSVAIYFRFSDTIATSDFFVSRSTQVTFSTSSRARAALENKILQAPNSVY